MKETIDTIPVFNPDVLSQTPKVKICWKWRCEVSEFLNFGYRVQYGGAVLLVLEYDRKPIFLFYISLRECNKKYIQLK